MNTKETKKCEEPIKLDLTLIKPGDAASNQLTPSLG